MSAIIPITPPILIGPLLITPQEVQQLKQYAQQQNQLGKLNLFLANLLNLVFHVLPILGISVVLPLFVDLLKPKKEE
jgi:hypothetical protein